MNRRRGCRPSPRLLALSVLLLLGGCGYRLGYPRPAGVETVALEVFDNRSRRREVEIELSRAIAREITRRSGLRLVARRESADLVIGGVIESLGERITVEGRDDQPLSGTSTLVITLRLERRGAAVREQRIEVTVDLVPDSGVAGVSDASVREPWRELFELAAERVVMALEGLDPRSGEGGESAEGEATWRGSTGEAASPP